MSHPQARDGEPGRRADRFEKRHVDRPHGPAVEAAAHHQNAQQLGAGTGDRHDCVGVRGGDPRRLGGRQQTE